MLLAQVKNIRLPPPSLPIKPAELEGARGEASPSGRGPDLGLVLEENCSPLPALVCLPNARGEYANYASLVRAGAPTIAPPLTHQSDAAHPLGRCLEWA